MVAESLILAMVLAMQVPLELSRLVDFCSWKRMVRLYGSADGLKGAPGDCASDGPIIVSFGGSMEIL